MWHWSLAIEEKEALRPFVEPLKFDPSLHISTAGTGLADHYVGTPTTLLNRFTKVFDLPKATEDTEDTLERVAEEKTFVFIKTLNAGIWNYCLAIEEKEALRPFVEIQFDPTVYINTSGNALADYCTGTVTYLIKRFNKKFALPEAKNATEDTIERTVDGKKFEFIRAFNGTQPVWILLIQEKESLRLIVEPLKFDPALHIATSGLGLKEHYDGEAVDLKAKFDKNVTLPEATEDAEDTVERTINQRKFVFIKTLSASIWNWSLLIGEKEALRPIVEVVKFDPSLHISTTGVGLTEHYNGTAPILKARFDKKFALPVAKDYSEDIFEITFQGIQFIFIKVLHNSSWFWALKIEQKETLRPLVEPLRFDSSLHIATSGNGLLDHYAGNPTRLKEKFDSAFALPKTQDYEEDTLEKTKSETQFIFMKAFNGVHENWILSIEQKKELGAAMKARPKN